MSTQIRVGALDGFGDLIFELGGDPSRILGDVGLDESLWQTPDALISTSAYRRALNRAAAATNTPRFGLLLSQRQTFDKLGAVGYLVKHAPNLRSASDQLIAFFQTHDSGTVSRLTVDDSVALWTHALVGLEGESAVQQTDLALGLAVKFIRTVLNANWVPDAVYFEHGRPSSTRLYERIFRCPIYFDQDLAGVEFCETELDRPFITSDPKLHGILHEYLTLINDQRASDLVSRVRAEIMNAMAAIDEGRPSLDQIAASVSMSRSQLQRHLKQEGTSFHSLLEEVRSGLARKYLKDTDLPLSTIAEMLGYAEPAVFTRAFKRQAGETPRDWRKKARQAPS